MSPSPSTRLPYSSPGVQAQPTDTERTPLLNDNSAIKLTHEEVYRRFSPSQKRVLLALVSASGLLPFFISGTFVPSIPQIAKDLNSTGPVVSLAISLSILAASLGGLIGSSYSTFYGRRPVYLVTLPLLIVGSAGVSLARNIPELMICRFIQALGASPGMSVGAGVIGDIYKLEERGQAMGIYLAASLLGPALAPLVGGTAAHYASWRIMQFSLGVCGVATFISTILFLPETSHPGTRGIDKLIASGKRIPQWRPVILNPFSPLWLLKSPNLFLVAISGYLILLTDYVLLMPLAYTIGVRYNIKNEALIGACFLPAGLGNMIGAPLAGRISDKIVTRWREKRGGVWYPEDRLRATLSGALFFVPVSVLVSGLLTEYVHGKLGLVLNLFCLFLNGIGVDIVLSPSAAYNVDLMHSRSAEAMAANNGFRSIIMSLSIAAILPMINTYGVVFTNTISAILAWIGFVILWATIRHGAQLRAIVDVGFSTANNN
ncbi:major facilitator superfamily domain-containing protein [Cyathus striatus]|nr:major facilitator superfamily domain-containing protein [Cyathus striatus]